tara:strand:+ start:153 stop:878 length:726 start_codon:yes stop_codon:yes gene_type:complete
MQILIFENEDISQYIWKFISFNDYKKFANVSKYFAKLYKNMSFNDMLKSKYCELNNIVKFCNFSVKHIAKISKYDNEPQFMNILLQNYFQKYNLEEYIKSEYFIIVYDVLEIMMHGIHRKFGRILEKINKCKKLYSGIELNDKAYMQIMQLLINIGNDGQHSENRRSILKSYYSNTVTITKIALTSLIFIMVDEVKINASKKKLIEMRKYKGEEFVRYIQYNNLKLVCPKYFLKRIQQIYK